MPQSVKRLNSQQNSSIFHINWNSKNNIRWEKSSVMEVSVQPESAIIEWLEKSEPSKSPRKKILNLGNARSFFRRLRSSKHWTILRFSESLIFLKIRKNSTLFKNISLVVGSSTLLLPTWVSQKMRRPSSWNKFSLLYHTCIVRRLPTEISNQRTYYLNQTMLCRSSF